MANTREDVGWQKANMSATAAPANTDDNTQGYDIGSRWHDVSNDKSYVCLDAQTDAAVWKQTTGGEANTGSNVGTGAEVFKGKTGADLQHRRVKAGSTKAVVTQNTNDISIDVDGGKVLDGEVAQTSGHLVKTAAETYKAIKDNATASNPGTSDDSTGNYERGSRWVNTSTNAEYVCLDPAEGAAVWKETTAGASAVVDQAIPLPVLNMKVDSYTAVGPAFIFRGSSVMGDPSSIHAIVGVVSASGYDARVYDLDNSKVICEKSGGSESFPSIVDLGAISNVPTGAAIWEFQIRRNGGSGNNSIEGSSLDMRF